MGGNWSKESKASIATFGPPPIPSSFDHRPSYRPNNPAIRPRPTTLPPAPAPAPAPAKANRITAFHSAANWKAYFEASRTSNKLVVVEFTATWCGPCQYMEPTLNEYAAKYTDVDFVKIDVDELFNVASEYGIQAMPTFLLLKRGKDVDKVVGVRKEELQRKIEKHRV